MSHYLLLPTGASVNDTAQHMAGIAAMAEKYPDLQGIELMAYHDLGKDKGLRIGKAYALNQVETTDLLGKGLFVALNHWNIAESSSGHK